MHQLKEAKRALKKYYGYDHFRPMQEDIIQSVFARKDTVVLMPTGGGKSICYQIPGLVMEGTCLVISPLISLMKDQVEGLKANGIKAAYINSSMTLSDIRETEDQFIKGGLQLLYISPEKITSGNFLPVLKRAPLNMIAIDEAHCISAWGHDFRPEYTQLQFLKRQFPELPIIALTATADKLTRKDIVHQLNLSSPDTYIASFDRPNLSLTVRPGQKRLEQILAFLADRPDQSGIVYCLSRKSTENLANKLVQKGYKARAYHAGLAARERAKVQEDFINDTVPIVCATIAFGMGIDKSNVRWVIHYNLPKNLEGYYQEIGRAGRDGVKADTLLFYSYQDVMMMRDILSDNNSENQEIQLAKLDRMRQYAEASACRRRILLGYFSEDLENDCGNCDVCKNPPESFDGTVISQKALSAIYRLKQKVSMGMLIDVLRGSSKKEIIQNNYHKIKTFAAGRDIPYGHWQQYLFQLLNLGYIEIAHHQQNQVRLTESSKAVLFEGRKVELVKPATIRKRQEDEKAAAQKATKKKSVDEELFQILRQLRKQLAQSSGLPPYRIFSDATLIDMSGKKPFTEMQMLQVHGVGEQKLKQFGASFLNAILEYAGENKTRIKGSTYQITLHLLKRGHSIEEIAQERGIHANTVFSHLAHLYEKGHPIDLSPHLHQSELNELLNGFKQVAQPPKMKEVFELFDGEFSYNKIRLAQAYLKRNSGN
ncbi:MAG: DNA helicase RecQ [Bacteroidota bacterium]